MKILHVVEAFGGGVYSFLVDLCNELINKYEIILVYSVREQTPKSFRNDFDKKIKFIEIDMCRGLNPYKNIISLFELKKILKFENPDIIHLHSSKAGFLGRLASYINGFEMNKIFYNPHGFSFLQQNESKFKRKVYFELEKFAAKFGGNIVGCSKGEYKEALKISNRCVNINNGINTKKIDDIVKIDNLDRKISNKKIIIGTVGRICYQKNPILFNKIAERFPEYDFIWIGDGDLKSSLKSNNIKITGWLDKNKVIKEMLKFNIFILTSLWEGLPIALLEAMYLKRICVVSNVIGNKDVIKDNVNGFVCKSIYEYDKKIKYIIKNEEDFNIISKNAYKDIIENYNINKMVSEYIGQYKRQF
jgi:glycosyltransferase involved in cell wall biosynthesis